jgi:hypothetical protein
MDRTAAALIAFAAGPDNMERRAAAMLLLAELGVDDEGALAAAAAALASPTVLQDFGLRYLEKLRPAGGLPAVLAALDAPDPGVRERVRRLAVTYGARAVPAIVRAARGASKPWLAGAFEVLAAIATGPALAALATLAAGGDGELARGAADALHRTIRGLDDAGRAALLRHVLAAAALPKAATSAPARLVLIRACAALGLPGARRWLLEAATRAPEPLVRSEALAALATCLRNDKLLAAEVTALSALLGDGDFSQVVRPALALLESHHFGADAQPFLLGLCASPHVAVRSFALAKLGDSAAPGAVRALLGSLDDADAVRRSAAGSLRKIPAARQELMKRFLAATDASTAFTMAETLAGYGSSWRRPILDQVWRRYQKAFESEDRIAGAYLHFLRAAAPDHALAALRSWSAALLKAGRARDAARLRQTARELPTAEPEDAYQLALALVKSRRRGLDAPFRRPDAALDLLVGLEDGRFPTATRLKRERALATEELYAIGFALAEASGTGRRVGEEILGHLASRHPRTKLGKSARNKLHLGA